MEYIQKLEQHFRGLGWFTGRKTFTIEMESEFEGFYGKASENWEKRVSIHLDPVIGPNGQILSPAISVTGSRHDKIDDVAKTAYEKLQQSKFFETICSR